MLLYLKTLIVVQKGESGTKNRWGGLELITGAQLPQPSTAQY